MSTYRKKLIEVALPLQAINAASAREKSIRHGHPSTLHLWWARRPLAACRAVLFAQLVDDPSAWPEHFPTEGEQDAERERIFGLMRELVTWEATTDEAILYRARLEIARSFARAERASGSERERTEGGGEADGGGARAQSPVSVLLEQERPAPEIVLAYLAERVPPVHDPFAGGGSIPLEAQRLGLRAIATDLNPVAVLINKALIEIPPKFAGMPPVNPEDRDLVRTWRGAEGLAADVRYYGRWMREEARKRIGHLYGEDLTQPEQKEGKVIAWLWARTVPSPDPAFADVHVPLVSSYWLSKKKGQCFWVSPIIDRVAKIWRFEVKSGVPQDPSVLDVGTKRGRGANFFCIMSGSPIGPKYVKACAQAGQLKSTLIAVVVKKNKKRIFVDASSFNVEQSLSVEWAPNQSLPNNPRWFSPPEYGMKNYRDLFVDRQLRLLTTLCDLVTVLKGVVEEDGGSDDYVQAMLLFMGFGLSKLADAQSSLVRWKPERNRVITTFSRHALPMIWNFAESNPFANGSGDFGTAVSNMARVFDTLPVGSPEGHAAQEDVQNLSSRQSKSIFSTDPPYYDNIGYADLSDFFYVWLKPCLSQSFPDIFTTMSVPKASELVATPYRHGNKLKADTFFMEGMTHALSGIALSSVNEELITVYYAFKQSELKKDGVTSTGWESFLQAIMDTGLSLNGTWPVRTERGARSISIGTNALASSIVLVCRKRPDDAPTTNRRRFQRRLKKDLPAALRALQKGNIAPVDMAQASIGPGMAIFSRHARILEPDGSDMTVRTALQLINHALDEYLTDQEGELDADSRFAVTWFETYGFEPGPFGEAETLAKARDVAVQGIQEAGVITSGGGRVQLIGLADLPDGWDPRLDDRSTIWEATHHLAKRLAAEGAEGAAKLLKALGSDGEKAKDLAYRLYSVCERRGWAQHAQPYNALVADWAELTRLAESAEIEAIGGQTELF